MQALALDSSAWHPAQWKQRQGSQRALREHTARLEFAKRLLRSRHGSSVPLVAQAGGPLSGKGKFRLWKCLLCDCGKIFCGVGCELRRAVVQISFVEETALIPTRSHARSNDTLTDVVAENLDQLGNLTALGVDVAHICEELKKRAQAVAAPVQPPNWSIPPLLGQEPGPDHQRRSSVGVLAGSAFSRHFGQARERGKLEAEIGSLRSELVQLHCDASQDLQLRSQDFFPNRRHGHADQWCHGEDLHKLLWKDFHDVDEFSDLVHDWGEQIHRHRAPHCAIQCTRTPVGST